MNPTDQLASAPLMPFYVAAAIAAAGLLLVLRPGRAAMRRAGAVIGLAGFGMLMAQGLKLAGPSDGSVSTPFYMAFAAIGIIGAVRVITHPRPVFAAIYFVLTVLAAGGSGGPVSCFLYANVTQLIPSSVVSSGLYESTR
jgi:NADH:ubiquinone oxidoreductase subunit 6 (subunit J)